MNEKSDKTQWQREEGARKGGDEENECGKEGEIRRAEQTDRAIERRGEGSHEPGEEEIWSGK